MSHAKMQKLCEGQIHNRGTRVYAQKCNGLWTAVTRDKHSHEDILLVVHACRHRGQWVTTADDFMTENDDESSISSLSDS
eukprot:2733373-Ditylum_brightwellii.AAC.1